LNGLNAKLKIDATAKAVIISTPSAGTILFSLTPRFSGVLAMSERRKTVSTVFRAVEGRTQ
jgi:hypothetical protein